MFGHCGLQQISRAKFACAVPEALKHHEAAKCAACFRALFVSVVIILPLRIAACGCISFGSRVKAADIFGLLTRSFSRNVFARSLSQTCRPEIKRLYASHLQWRGVPGHQCHPEFYDGPHEIKMMGQSQASCIRLTQTV